MKKEILQLTEFEQMVVAEAIRCWLGLPWTSVGNRDLKRKMHKAARKILGSVNNVKVRT